MKLEFKTNQGFYVSKLIENNTTMWTASKNFDEMLFDTFGRTLPKYFKGTTLEVSVAEDLNNKLGKITKQAELYHSTNKVEISYTESR